jgi:hypothetical protein
MCCCLLCLQCCCVFAATLDPHLTQLCAEQWMWAAHSKPVLRVLLAASQIAHPLLQAQMAALRRTARATQQSQQQRQLWAQQSSCSSSSLHSRHLTVCIAVATVKQHKQAYARMTQQQHTQWLADMSGRTVCLHPPPWADAAHVVCRP